MSESYQQPKYNYLTYHINIYPQFENFSTLLGWASVYFKHRSIPYWYHEAIIHLAVLCAVIFYRLWGA